MNVMEGLGWSAVGSVEAKGKATVHFGPGSDGVFLVEVSVEPYASDLETFTTPMVVARATLLPEGNLVPRKLRRLATFHRGQGRLPAEMDVDDELRALSVLAKTLEQLEPAAQARALDWLVRRGRSRGTIPPGPPPTYGVEESIRLAREHVLGDPAVRP